MLRLSIYCPTPQGVTQTRSIGSLQLIKHHKPPFRRVFVVQSALKDGGDNGGTSSFQGSSSSWQPDSEIGIPFEQRPVNEYSDLKDSTLYSWAELGTGPFLLRIGGLWLGALTVLGVPISAASFDPSKGWSYVGDRLLSAVIPYEETGWYDGQMWAKPPEVLARDRLLGSYKVKPVIKMLKQTLVGIGALLVSAVSLFVFAIPVQDFFFANRTTHHGTVWIKASSNVCFACCRKEELFKLPVDVKTDDDLAAAAAKAADGRPAYCRDRYYRALAGGQYCKWEDLLD
ncbi:Protein CONSERVED IN THE GREEN LINEAGE AND DIATOMS 27, chloroplastic [Linum perenne]